MPNTSQAPNSDSNKVITHDNYVEVIWIGPQDSSSVSLSSQEALKAIEALKAAGKPVLLSLSLLDLPLRPDMGAFREVIKIFRSTTFDKIAISGTVSPMVMTLIATVTSSFNKELDIAYFVNKDEALAWLMSPKK